MDGVPSSASRWISFRATISLVVLDRPWKDILSTRLADVDGVSPCKRWHRFLRLSNNCELNYCKPTFTESYLIFQAI